MEIALEAGAEDLRNEEDTYEVITPLEDFEAVRNALAQADIPVGTAEITMVPKSTVSVEGNNAASILKLLEALEDLDDVQNVYANFDIDPSHFSEG